GTPALAPGVAYYYQWFKNGVPIPGANGASYTTAPAVDSDSNTVYSVCFANDFSTNCSVTATQYVLPCVVVVGCSTRNDPNHVYVTYNRPVHLDGVYSLDPGSGLFVYSVDYAPGT